MTILFNERNLGDAINTRKAEIITALEGMGEKIATIQDEDEFVARTIKAYLLPSVSVDFTEMSVEPFFKPKGRDAQEVHINYMIPFKGDSELLKANSNAKTTRPFNIRATINNGHITIDLPTGYHNSLDLPDATVQNMNATIAGVRQHVEEQLHSIRTYTEDFNKNLDANIRAEIKARKTKYEQKEAITDKLNPFKKKDTQ